MANSLTQIQLGQRIRQARERVGISQRDFAQAVSKDQKAISEYEIGKRRIAAVELADFAQVLGVPITYFFEGEFGVDELDQVLLNEFRALSTQEEKQEAITILRIFANATKRSSK